MRLDHLAIAAETLDEGASWAKEKLGVSFLAGGNHARYATHNKLLGLADGLYLEVIAVDPDAKSDGPRWFGLDHFRGPPRLVNWICEPENFHSMLRHGMEKVAMQRGDLRWDMGVPRDGSLPLGGGFPTVLKWHTDHPPAQSLPASGVALQHLTIYHPQADAIKSEVALSDARVRFEIADDIRLSAQFDTPNGAVTL